MISLGRAHLRAQEHDRVSQLAPPGGTALRPFDELSYEELARAHHGLVSKERRKLIEEDLKSGRLRAVCGNELSGAGNRHGLGRPRHSGRGAAPSSVPSELQPIAEGWDEAAAAARLASDPERAVGEALPDQQVIAGWATSTVRDLLLSGLSPWQEVGAVPDLRRVMAPGTGSSSSIARAGPLTTGDLRRGRTHWVYGHFGLPCLRCGTRIPATSR